jgi:hypothetical protein
VLHQLSEVTEAITWRLLELEERLQAQEECLQLLKVTAAANDLRLAERWTGPWVPPRSDWPALKGC